MTIQDDFLSAIRHFGLTPPDRLVADGHIHRFRSGPERAENGFYRLVVVPAHKGGDIGFGTIGCWKRDIREKWCSRDANALTEPDHRAMRKAREELKKKDDEAAEAAAAKAGSVWKAAVAPDLKHPYLLAKQIGPKGLRQYKDALVVPATRDGKVTSLQFISPDGSKRFLTGGRMDGAYTSLSTKDGPKDRIVIAEGFATAASLHAATGLPVIVAFNAGNILPVAKAIRAKYPDAKLVIASDHDQWTVVRGKHLNVGLVRAGQAAEAVGGVVAVPPFPKDDPERRTDWNDWAVLHGLEATRAAFEAAAQGGGQAPDGGSSPQPAVPIEDTPAESAPPPGHPASDVAVASPYLNDWRARLIPGKEVAEGHPFPFEKKSKANAFLFLKHHHRFDGILCYNEFSDDVMLVRRPPWDEGDFSPRSIRDDDFFMFTAHLEYCGVTVGKDTAADAALRVAKENPVNPPREYLSRLKWDGKPRLDTWLTYYLGADNQPSEYLALVGAKWLIGAVSRVFAPGCKFDTVLILEGEQGLGKSMALRALATFGGEDFFLDSVGDIRSKDTLMTMQGKLIVEIAELASFKKTENEEIKAFITRQVDEYRPPYGRTVLKRPRYFVLAASTNEVEEGYLTDETGGRRYWPVKCGAIDIESVRRDAEQLWAEAVVRFRAGERTWLTRDEAVYSTQEQKQRFVEDAWQERIGELVKHEFTARVDELLTKLELKPKDVNNLVKKRVKNSLRQLGWVETRRQGEGRVWRPARLVTERGR
ncbi:VapE family protein [Gemmata sp. JC717]|uniref:VapE domain-containing protein n=1 Tax=Gemmata algarum TaxID=2975278 RepID=UPI0021BAE74F|nr:VapE domain-containing protein [Gemmata algarum]MDY3551421.1 VapE family protein [Gemmata algarum]